MKKILTIILILSLISCKQNEITTADLAFKLIGFGSLYNANHEQIEKFEKTLDSINKNPNANANDKQLAYYVAKIKKNGLYSKPYINLRMRNDSTIVVYLSESEYNKVKDYNYVDLLKRKKKVELQLELIKKDIDLYYSNKIISIKEVDGQTYWKK